MTTGRSIVSTCAARAALAGNPSDGYGGAVVAIPIPDLTAMAALEESGSGAFVHRSSDPELSAVVDATVAAYTEMFGAVPAVELSLSTNIPRSVGLAGSSALIIATLRALRAFDNERWEPIPLATAALAIERERLGIEAGLQDRLVQAVGKPVSMSFDPVSFDTLEIGSEFHFFVAWALDAAEPSDTVHRSLRRRFDGGDPAVRTAMSELRIQAGRARRGIASADPKLLADAMHRTMAIRLDITELPAGQRRLIEVGRTAGAAVNSAGSGGSIVGLARHPEHLEMVLAAYRDAAIDVFEIV